MIFAVRERPVARRRAAPIGSTCAMASAGCAAASASRSASSSTTRRDRPAYGRRSRTCRSDPEECARRVAVRRLGRLRRGQYGRGGIGEQRSGRTALRAALCGHAETTRGNRHVLPHNGSRPGAVPKPVWTFGRRNSGKLNVKRVVADAKPGFPDRVELRDAEPGETLLLLNYLHQPVDTPYRASHAIFVREGATAAYEAVDETPECLAIRPISLRAFDASGMMVDADWRTGARSRPPSGACSAIPLPPISTPTTPSAAATPPGSIGREGWRS